MRRLIAAEFHKLATTRLWLWLLLGSVALTALYASLAIAFGDTPDNPTPPLASPAGQRTVFSVGQGAGTLLAVLAAIGLTGEFRHQTATTTFLATPNRSRVVLAKLITYALVGVGYSLVCIAVTIAIALPWLNAKGIRVPLTGNGIPATLAGVVAAVTIFGLIGVGLGALVREQVATVVGLLVYLFIAEPIVTRIPALSSWTIYLPGAAASALTQVAQANQTFLPPGRGGLVLAAYGLLLAAAGILLTIRRDIT
ncbi:MAG TPA: ABC transporter permease [Actinomycetes bacterium]|jgi:ABC-2 type transport system permease protein|nr:ABC transporter permease [Actinomycetes bacterium]HEX2157896.1 ABC transporter permease [Actinomycetes bacterium]